MIPPAENSRQLISFTYGALPLNRVCDSMMFQICVQGRQLWEKAEEQRCPEKAPGKRPRWRSKEKAHMFSVQ